jgi:NADPH:quinone reductase-like Zn-dependent oxidoreductase
MCLCSTGWGGDYVKRGFSVLRGGGTLVEYSNPLSFSGLLCLLAKVLVYKLLPNGKRVKLYETTASRFSRLSLLEDWAILFKLLEEGKIKPIVAKKGIFGERTQETFNLRIYPLEK